MSFNFYDVALKAAGNAKNFITDIATVNNAIDVNVRDGAPYTFTKITSNASTLLLSKGALNEFSFYPRILNEQQVRRDQIQSVVTITNTVGQILKPSKDNISAIMFAAESAEAFVIDDFESYADSAALQAVWVTLGANPATLETDPVFTGSNSMNLPTIVDGDEWARTSTPQDFTGYTGLFKTIFSHPVNQLQIAVFIRDNIGNSKSFAVVQDGANILCSCEVNEAAMVDDQPTITDVANIADIGYRVILKRAGSYAKIDDLESVPAPGELGIKLWDMGAEIPQSGVTSIDDGTQYDQIGGLPVGEFALSLEGGKRLYHLEEFSAGVNKAMPLNKAININNYYILQFIYIDTDVSIYGIDTSLNTNSYKNGYAFTAPDEATPITTLGEFSDLMFGIMSTQEVYLTNVGWVFDSDPNGASSILIHVHDITPKVTDIVIDHEATPEKSFTSDLISRPMQIVDGGNLKYNYNDDPLDSVTDIRVEYTFWHEPPVVNG